MKVNAKLQLWDLTLFNLFLTPKLRSTYVVFFLLTIIVSVFVVRRHGLPDNALDWIKVGIASVGGAFGGIIVFLLFGLVLVLFSSAKAKGILGEHQYELTKDGFVEKTKVNESINRWNGIQSIRVVGPYLCVQISNHLYHLIPQRSFQSTEEFTDFVETARMYWKAPSG